MKEIFNSKRFKIALLLGVAAALFIPKFITFDTGIRCIQAPCDEASNIASFLFGIVEVAEIIHTDQRVVRGREQHLGEVTADKAGGAGDEDSFAACDCHFVRRRLGVAEPQGGSVE